MMETTKDQRELVRAALDNPHYVEFSQTHLRIIENAINDADRLAKYERDLFDERAGENRSQDTEWLRRGFLQRGAEIERLEDGIRALADRLDEISVAYYAMWKDGYSQRCEGLSDQAESDARALRALLQE